MNSVGEVISNVVDPDANIIVGQAVNESMEGEIQVTVIATGFETNQPLRHQMKIDYQVNLCIIFLIIKTLELVFRIS